MTSAPADGRGAPAAPAVSVVISTYNRGALLADAARSVLAQEHAPPFELVVVDNNSTAGTRELVAALARADARVRYVFEGRQGVSYGRNAGVAAARAPLVAFTDDDVRAGPDWVASVARAFAEHPWADFAGGRVVPRWPGPVPAWLTREHWAPLALVDHGDAPVRVDLDRAITLVTCNAAFRRAAFERAGGFDPRFQHRPGASSACEDQELELRMLAAGALGVYVPYLVIEAEVQPNRLTQAYHRKWHRDHGRAVVDLLGPDEDFDLRGVPSPLRNPRRTLFGAPPWAYRAVAVESAKAAWARLRGRPDAAFGHACAADEARGHLAGRLARWRGARSGGGADHPSARPATA